MKQKVRVAFTVFFVLGIFSVLGAQELPLLWFDTFDDDDQAARYDVGWFYYSEQDGLSNSLVEQQDGTLYLKMGSFGGLVGAVVAGTNGVPKLELNEAGDDLTDETKQMLKDNNFSSPNIEILFQVNFTTITSSFLSALHE